MSPRLLLAEKHCFKVNSRFPLTVLDNVLADENTTETRTRRGPPRDVGAGGRRLNTGQPTQHSRLPESGAGSRETGTNSVVHFSLQQHDAFHERARIIKPFLPPLLRFVWGTRYRRHISINKILLRVKA